MNDDQAFSTEEDRLKFEQEIAIIWGVSSHPNIITLVGFSENPRRIITKVLIFYLLFFYFISFLFILVYFIF